MRLRTLLVMIVFLLLMTPTCQTPKTAPPLRVGIDSFVGFAPIYLARDRNIYKELGIDVDPQMIMATVDRNSAFASGRLDALCTTADSLLLLAANGVDLVIVGAVDESLGADGIVARPNIQTIKDLKNKTVGFQEGMPSHFFILWVLEKNGMKKSDILPVNMNADEAGAAFMAGKIDAAVTWEPWLSQAANSGKGKIIVSSADYPNTLIDVLAVRRDVFDRRQRDVVALYQGWMRAVELWKAEPEESERLMSEKIKLDLDTFRKNLKALRLADQSFNEQLFKPGGGIWTLADQAIPLWKRARVIDPNSTFDPRKHITDRVVTLSSNK